jgi:electron transfer flavoprotein beta subunit
MNIIVAVNLIPDLVEELTINESGTALDMTWLRLILNEFDDQALEQAILLKERDGCQVTVIAPDGEGANEVLYTAVAKGADRLIKLTGDFEEGVNNHALARIFTTSIKLLNPDLVLTGVQAHNDLDGQIGPLLAEYLGFPYLGYIAGVKMTGGKVTVCKEYPGGLIAEMEVTMPAVLGIQAAEAPPRYVAFSKVRQAMKTAAIEEQMIDELDTTGGPTISRMFQPEVGKRAVMLEGEAEEIAARLLEIIHEHGVV